MRKWDTRKITAHDLSSGENRQPTTTHDCTKPTPAPRCPRRPQRRCQSSPFLVAVAFPHDGGVVGGSSTGQGKEEVGSSAATTAPLLHPPWARRPTRRWPDSQRRLQKPRGWHGGGHSQLSWPQAPFHGALPSRSPCTSETEERRGERQIWYFARFGACTMRGSEVVKEMVWCMGFTLRPKAALKHCETFGPL
jgi:hypothetical protein